MAPESVYDYLYLDLKRWISHGLIWCMCYFWDIQNYGFVHSIQEPLSHGCIIQNQIEVKLWQFHWTYTHINILSCSLSQSLEISPFHFPIGWRIEPGVQFILKLFSSVSPTSLLNNQDLQEFHLIKKLVILILSSFEHTMHSFKISLFVSHEKASIGSDDPLTRPNS